MEERQARSHHAANVMHLAMDTAHGALRATHSQRHVLGKPSFFPAKSFTVVALHIEMMISSGDLYAAVPCTF